MNETTERTCPFCGIVNGEHEADVVYRDTEVVAFLDHRPLFKGHVLVAPRRHAETLGDLGDAELTAVMRVVRAVSRADESALGAEGSFVAVNNRISQSVPHLHVHVVPRHKGDGLRGFFWPREKYEDEPERAQYASRLKAGLAKETERDGESAG